MESSNLNRIKTSKAYPVFISECGKFLSSLQKNLQAPDSFHASVVSELRNEFHKIKGGASFFGLDDLSSFAGMLEVAAINLDPKTLKKELACNLDRLKELILALPQPSSGNDVKK